MSSSRSLLLFAAFLAAAAASDAAAAQESAAPPPASPAKAPAVPSEVTTLVTNYVAAFNARDTARLHELSHPQSLACITPENQSFYDEALQARLLTPIGAKYTLRLSPVNEHNLKALAAAQRFPVKPSDELHIDWQNGADAGSLVLWLVRDNGTLYIDAPCATAQALKEYQDDAPAREARRAANKALAAAIEEPLRSELLTLLRDHKWGAATQRYKEASGKDYPTSALVINELALDVPR